MIGIPKPSPHMLKQQQVRAERDRIDRAERVRCRHRSGGRCEVIRTIQLSTEHPERTLPLRCEHRATENHHLISGLGRRNRGRSLKAEHRLDVCAQCHREITNHVLVPSDWTTREYAATVTYERKV